MIEATWSKDATISRFRIRLKNKNIHVGVTSESGSLSGIVSEATWSKDATVSGFLIRLGGPDIGDINEILPRLFRKAPICERNIYNEMIVVVSVDMNMFVSCN